MSEPKDEAEEAATAPEGTEAKEATEATEAKAAPSDADAGAADSEKSAPPPKKLPETEAEINSPDRRTLGLLGVIFIVTAASWGSARLACNYHPPQSRPAPQATTERLAKTAKDAAIELMHRWKTRDYEGALELAKGGLADTLKKELAACDAEGAKCISERKRLKMTVLTTGIVKEKTDGAAVAVVTTRKGDETERYEVRVERDGPIWRATAQKKL